MKRPVTLFLPGFTGFGPLSLYVPSRSGGVVLCLFIPVHTYHLVHHYVVLEPGPENFSPRFELGFHGVRAVVFHLRCSMYIGGLRVISGLEELEPTGLVGSRVAEHDQGWVFAPGNFGAYLA